MSEATHGSRLQKFTRSARPPFWKQLFNRYALPARGWRSLGEFTLRAFLAGRIDLPQAEAVLGVIDAADRRQLQTSLAQLAGGFSGPLVHLRSDLLNLLADLEAGLDFTEEDIRFIAADEMVERVSTAEEELAKLAARLGERTIAGRLPRVALVGPPNAGKSSLFNALIEDRAAIVSPQAGTTRDYLAGVLDADGLQVELIDTAGVIDENSPPTHQIDQAAKFFAFEQSRQADMSVVCCAANDPWPSSAFEDRTLCVVTKIDLVVEPAKPLQDQHTILTSSKRGDGLPELRAAIRRRLETRTSGAEVIATTAARVGQSLELAMAALQRLGQLVQTRAGDELAAAELRGALAELGKVAGAVYTDDLLDRIFSRFCIGK